MKYSWKLGLAGIALLQSKIRVKLTSHHFVLRNKMQTYFAVSPAVAKRQEPYAKRY